MRSVILFYIGGNDSMDTVDKMSKYCKENGVDDVFVVGAPKTIDNDLVRNGSLPGLWICGKISGSNLCRAGERLPCI